jgi:hypothetical protein
MNILSKLSLLDYLTRSQIQFINDLGGDRNAQKILKDMSDYISHFRDGENIYYLNAKGRSIVGGKPRSKTLQARHYIMRNYIYIAFGQPDTWQSEQRMELKMKDNKKITVVADALFYDVEKTLYVVEADHTQKMIKNEKKVEKYRQLIDLGAIGKKTKFIWITTTEYRREKLKRLCEGLNTTIFTAAEFS